MAVLSIFKEISVGFAFERDISFYMFQNISCTKLILIHEKIPDIKVVLRIG